MIRTTLFTCTCFPRNISHPHGSILAIFSILARDSAVLHTYIRSDQRDKKVVQLRSRRKNAGNIWWSCSPKPCLPHTVVPSRDIARGLLDARKLLPRASMTPQSLCFHERGRRCADPNRPGHKDGRLSLFDSRRD